MGRRKKPEKKDSFVKKDTKANAEKLKKERNATKSFTRLLGMKDVLASDYKILEPIINKIEDTASCYSFDKIETPLIEGLPLYKKVLDKNKLDSLFSVEQKGQEKSCLRPDLIHGISRALIEHNILNTQEKPSKFFSMGPVFRQEVLRSGVYKQFTQFNFSIFNDIKPSSDALLISIIYNIFRELQIDVQVQVNSMGDQTCQKEFLQKFSKALKEKSKKAKLCPNCKKNSLKNPALLLECQEESCIEIRNEMPQIINHLSEESNARFYKTLEFLDEMGVNYNFNPYLIKDMGYYNDLIFEVWPIDKNGEVNSKLSLGRGGRYDNLFVTLTGRDLPLLSFNGGLERVFIKLKESGHIFDKNKDDVVFLGQIDDKAKIKAMSIFKDLRKRGFNVFQAFHLNDLRNQMEEAKSCKANIVLVLGKKELADETILFRDMESGVQEIVAQKDLISRLEKKIKI
ncbi:MAG: ATP phosphoribosyltransferase regulatory subunit [Patescibacteria group bacterium]